MSFLNSLQECPSGVVNEENFKTIYSQFFPQGGKFSTWKAPAVSFYCIYTIPSIFIQFIDFRQRCI